MRLQNTYIKLDQRLNRLASKENLDSFHFLADKHFYLTFLLTRSSAEYYVDEEQYLCSKARSASNRGKKQQKKRMHGKNIANTFAFNRKMSDEIIKNEIVTVNPTGSE